MKKLLISLTLLFLVLSAFAQSNRDIEPHLSSPTAKGTIILSGSTNLSFASINNEAKLNSDFGGESYEYDSNNFSFSPSIGWFVTDGLALAITMDYESSKQEDEVEAYKESTFLIGPSLTYYFGSSNIKPFILGEYLFGSTKADDDGEETSVSVNGWGLGGGVAFFLNQHISLNLGLGYANMTAKPEDTVGYDVEIVSKGIAFDAGLSIYF
jgi:opacity protein-like surface antigen